MTMGLSGSTSFIEETFRRSAYNSIALKVCFLSTPTCVQSRLSFSISCLRIIHSWLGSVGQVIPWRDIGVGLEVGSSGLSVCTIRRAKSWLKSCLSCKGDHFRCKPYKEEESYLPARVIDIGTADEDPIRLHISRHKETGRYVALSHCWGAKKFSTTTQTSLQRYTKNIPLPLPRTFMDAVRVTRALGVRFLWIDSFCIIQDSVEDWHAQAPQMAGIYGNAYLTIAADAASDSTEGFLDSPRRSLNNPQCISFNCSGLKGVVYVKEHCPRAENLPVHDWIRLDDDRTLPSPAKRDYV
jgi:hypothetical protein